MATGKAQPSKTQLGGTQPVETQPAGTQPAATQPAGTQPAATQPTGTQPAATQPTGTQPAATQPTGTQPVATQPTGTQPVARQPTGTQPVPQPATQRTQRTAAPRECFCFSWIHLDENGQACFADKAKCDSEFQAFGRTDKIPCQATKDRCSSYACRNLGKECFAQ